MANSVDPNGLLNVSYTISGSPLQEFAVQFWVQPNAPGGVVDQTLAFLEQDSGFALFFLREASGLLSFYFDGTGSPGYVPTSVTADGAAKYYMAFCRQSVGGGNYKDALFVFEEGNATPVWSADPLTFDSTMLVVQSWLLFGEPTPTYNASGPFASFRVTPQYLGATQLWTEATSATPVIPAYANYRLSSAATAGADSSGNGRDGTATGTGLDSAVSFYGSPSAPAASSFFGCV